MNKANLLLVGLMIVLGVICVSEFAGTPVLMQTEGSNRPQLVLQTGHAQGVNSIAFGPDDSWVASAGADNSIIIWQTSSGRQLRALKGHTGYVRSVAISPDGRWLASGGSDRKIKIWDVDSGTEVFSEQKHTGPIVSVAFSHDGRWVASGSTDKTIKIWDLTTKRELKTLSKHIEPLSALAFSQSGNSLISAADVEVVVWDTNTWQDKQTFKRNTTPVTAVAFGDDETTAASAATDGSVLVWRVGSDRERFALKHNSSKVVALKFSNNALLGIHADGGIDSWDLQNGKQKQSVAGEVNGVPLSFAALSNDGSIIAFTTSSRILSTRKRDSGELIRNFDSYATAINSIAFSADGRWFASATNDSSVRLWQVVTGRELPRLVGHAGYVATVAFSPDNSLLASGSRSGQVKIWDVNSAQLAYDLPSRTEGVNRVAFSSDGKFLAVAGMNPKLEVWDLEKKQVRTLDGHKAEITSVAFTKNLIISSGRDKTIRLWDANTGAPVNSWETPSEINGIATSANGDLLATANVDNTVRTWDVKSGNLKNTFMGHTAEVWAVRVSPDGTSIASTSSDQSLIVWDLQKPDGFHQLKAGSDKVKSVAYSGDGKWILTGSDDGTILVWETSTRQLMATVVSLPGSDDWLVVTPDGLFDGSPESWNRMLWRFEQGTFKVVPVEAYFNEFYHPSVLGEILTGQKPKAVQDIAQKDRRQPLISLKTAGPTDSRDVKIDIALSTVAADNSHPNDSGARDLRLFRNGLLIKTWAGDVTGNNKSTTIQATIPIVAGANKFTAYVFNNDHIKSSDANLLVTGPENLKRQGTAYLLMIGVEQYENSAYNLRYSAADVTEMASQLKIQQERLGKFSPIVPLPLINADATKANILLALERLSGNTAPLPANAPAALKEIKPAQPEDAVVVYFSGHGISANNHFYLIPHDLGYNGPRKSLNAIEMAKLLKHGVSDDELEAALQQLDANQLLLVIDACYSGQAIESTEKRRGPMNTKGLAQLAYEKGIYVLTASQNMEVAFEAEAFKHSYLAHALLQEGLKDGLADSNPRDGNIFLREWFDYANRRVPHLRREILKRKDLVEEEADEQKVQRPRVFYTREEGAKTFLVGRRVLTN